MKIIYAYSSCSDKKYKELFHSSPEMILQQAQKYHSLLTEGLRGNGAEIICTSGLPVNRRLTKKLLFRHQNEVIDGIKYHYFGFINLPMLRQAGIMFGSFLKTCAFCKKRDNTTVICDILNISNTASALLAAKLRGVRAVGIVTDLPGYLLTGSEVKKGIKHLLYRLKTAFNQFVLERFDAYVFLTSQMNNLVNKRRRPYVVLEGHVDINMTWRSNLIEDKASEKIILYAGSLKRKYGIQLLTQAFIDAAIDECVLHVSASRPFRYGSKCTGPNTCTAVTKGSHWHHTKNEKFLVVSGSGVIRFRQIDSDEVLEYLVSGEKLEVVDIPVGYTHSIENLGDTDMVTIMWANEPFDPQRPDTYYLEV